MLLAVDFTKKRLFYQAQPYCHTRTHYVKCQDTWIW